MIPTEIAQAAYKTGKKYNLLPTAILSQWALETGWGKSQCSARNNNPFNIKGCDGFKVVGCSTCHDTIEKSNSQYRKYASLQDGFDAYGNLIAGNTRYKACIGESNPTMYFSALKAGGYATDKDYVAKLLKIHAQVLQNLPPVANSTDDLLLKGFLVALAAGGIYGLYKFY